MLQRVHHEFRTPLATLLGHVELLEEGTDLPSGLEASLRAISRSGGRLSRLPRTSRLGGGARRVTDG